MGRPKSISDDALLAVARQVFTRDGAAGSTAEIARRAGIAEATLFKRFATKTALFIAAMVPPPIDVDAVIATAKAAPDARSAILGIGEAVVAYFRSALPTALPLLTNPLIGIDELRRHFGRNAAEVLVEAIAEYLDEEAARGRVNAAEPFPSALAVVACAHAIAQFEVMELHEGAIPDSAVRAVFNALWEGYRPIPIKENQP